MFSLNGKDKSMEFVAIDVETANADMASICQIGIAKFVDGELVGEWSSLINPEDDFDYINVDIHGISEGDIVDAPTLPEVLDALSSLLSMTVCVSHTHFDRVSIYRAFNKYGLAHIETTWLDSARVARRAWEDCAWSGYGLASVCEKIGYQFKHHDALEDAKAAGQVLLAAIEKTRIELGGWCVRVEQPINLLASGDPRHIKREGDPEGELYGEVVVFTGSLSVPRVDAANLAAKIGCAVASGVTKKTTLLVVGDQDITKLAGKDKSGKHIKAEGLISKGQKIRIIKESDFVELANQAL